MHVNCKYSFRKNFNKISNNYNFCVVVGLTLISFTFYLFVNFNASKSSYLFSISHQSTVLVRIQDDNNHFNLLRI